MGNKFACGVSGTSRKRKNTQLEDLNLDEVDEALNVFVESLDSIIQMMRKLLNRPGKGLQDQSESRNKDQLHQHDCLEKLLKDKENAFEKVTKLLTFIRSVYAENDSSSKDRYMPHHENVNHLKGANKKGHVHEFEDSEFYQLDTFIARLEDENTRLYEQNETLIEESQKSQKKIDRLMKENDLLTETEMKDTEITNSSASAGALEKEKALMKTERGMHASLKSSFLQTKSDDLHLENGRTIELTENENERIEMETADLQTEDDMKTPNHLTQARGLDPANIKCSAKVELLSKQTQTEGLVTKNEDVGKLTKSQRTDTSDLYRSKEPLTAYKTKEDEELKENFNKEQKKQQIEAEKLRKQISDQKSDFENQKAALQQEVQTLQTKKLEAFQEFENRQKTFHQENERLQKELIEKNETLTKLKDSLEDNRMKAVDENAEIKSQIMNSFKQIQSYKLGQSSISNAFKNHEELMANFAISIQQLVDENKSLNEKNRTIKATKSSERKRLEKLITEQEEKTNQLDANAKTLTEQNLSLHAEIEALRTKNAEMLNELTTEVNNECKRRSEIEKALTRAKQDNLNLQEEYESLKQELDKFKSTKILRVQLYHHDRIPLVAETENELKALLKSEMEDEMTELDFTECGSAGDIDLNVPLLIVCISVSRIGTDAKNAIQSLKLTSKMALIIFHHKDVHALPSTASERVLTAEVFRRLGGVYDLAFLSRKGIYTCDMNLKNIKGLVYFLNKEGIRSVKEGL